MTADLSTVKYKRESVPVIADEQNLKTYFSDELQRVENTLNNHETIVQSVSTEVDGNLASFNSQISAQASATSAVVSSVSSLTATVGTNTAAITNEQTARANADSALATDITNLTATVTSGDSTNSAAITNEQTARANADSALATDITNLTATVASGDSTNAAAITNEQTARANADSALATDITNLTATVTSGDSTNAAAISSEATARANADSANAAAITNLTASVGSNTSAVAIAASAAATAQGAVNAKFGVTLDSNGFISGFESTNNGTVSTFKVAANTFEIRDPTLNTVPFLVSNGVCKMQNVEIGSNVIGLNSITHPHHTTVTTAYASTLNSFTEVGSLAFTPTAAGEVLFVVNFNNAAVNASSQVTASARVDYSIQLRLTVGSAAEFSMQGMNNLRIGGILTGHFGNSVLRTMSSSVINQLHTFKVYAKPTGFVSGAAKLGIYNLSMSATELYR